MSPEQSALLVALVAFLGVLLAPLIAGFVNDNIDRRAKRHEYIQSLVNDLIEVRSELQYYQKMGWEYSYLLLQLQQHQNSDDPTENFGIETSIASLRNSEGFQKMEIAYGKAYSIMISVDIPEIRAKADEVLSEKYNINPSLKLTAIDFALKTLGEQYRIFKKAENWRDP